MKGKRITKFFDRNVINERFNQVRGKGRETLSVKETEEGGYCNQRDREREHIEKREREHTEKRKRE